MKSRLYTLFPQKSYSANTTEVIDLNVTDPISSLLIGLTYTNAQATQTAHPMAILSKIELVDGSDVLFSLDGYEAEALDYYDNKGKLRQNFNYILNGGNGDRFVGINFGRWLFDPVFALDPKKFTNPQLRITIAVAAGGNASTPVYLTVWANIFDEKSIAPRGFFMSKEIKKYTIAASTHEYTDLPVDFPYRGIYFRGFVLGTEPNQVVSNIKLTEDFGKRIPFDHGFQDIERALDQMYGEFTEHFFFALDSSTRYIFCTPTTRVFATGSIWAAAGAVENPAFYDGDGGRLRAIATANPGNTQVIVRGSIPHCVLEIPVCDKDDENDYWNVAGIKSLKLDVTGAATAAASIFAQQVRSY